MRTFALVALVAALALAGCTGSNNTPTPTPTPTNSTPTTTATPSVTPTEVTPSANSTPTPTPTMTPTPPTNTTTNVTALPKELYNSTYTFTASAPTSPTSILGGADVTATVVDNYFNVTAGEVANYTKLLLNVTITPNSTASSPLTTRNGNDNVTIWAPNGTQVLLLAGANTAATSDISVAPAAGMWDVRYSGSTTPADTARVTAVLVAG